MLVLLIDIPINKEGPIDDELWDEGIAIAQKIPLEFKDNMEWKVTFKCNIGGDAIVFFKSRYIG